MFNSVWNDEAKTSVAKRSLFSVKQFPTKRSEGENAVTKCGSREKEDLERIARDIRQDARAFQKENKKGLAPIGKKQEGKKEGWQQRKKKGWSPMKNMDLTIYEVTELNERMKFLDLAKQHAPVGKEKLREALKSAGATFDQRTKRWHIDRSHPNADKKVLDFVQTIRSSVAKASRVATDPLKIDPVTGQSRLDDDYFAIETKPERIVRKKVSLDMDVILHKQLKQIALENDMKLYELVEGVLRDYVKKKKSL